MESSELKKVIVVWDFPQLTEDPVALAISLDNATYIEKIVIDCTNFRTGGKRLKPENVDDGTYTLVTGEPDLFKEDNPMFSSFPAIEDRYLFTCFGRGIVGAFDLIEDMFLDYFNKKYEVVKVVRLRDENL